MASTTSSSDGFVTNLTNAIIGEGAKLRRIVIQDFNDKVTLHNLENFDLLKDAQLTNVSLHLGSAEARLETKGSMLGSGAEFENFSLALGREDQLIDLRTMQHHLASNCRSNLVCKNALLNKSKSIFSGMIKVEKKARCSDALQTNRNLLMSEEAVADSIPGLEISANEVKCSHGATTSRIDEQELFYLLSRGIKPNHAEKLIALGFFEEVVEKIVLEEQMEIARNLISQKFDF
jgi:Fe-S cluster assembly protein SufD